MTEEYIECPQCHYKNPPGTFICENDGFPLSWHPDPEDSEDPPLPPQKPEHEPPEPGPEPQPRPFPDPAPSPGPAPTPQPQSDEPMIRCPVCGHDNPIGRTFCMYDGSLLVAPPEPPLPPNGRGVRRWWHYALAAAAVVAVVVVVGLIVIPPNGGSTKAGTLIMKPTPPESSSTEGPGPGQLTVDEATASRESPNHPTGLTIDGNDQTAWNHCDSLSEDPAECASTLVDAWLEFTFDASVDIERIEVKNGFWKGSLYPENSRIKTATLSTDMGENLVVEFEDQQAVTAVEVAWSGVSTVRLTIDDVYVGSEYIDVAVTEVEFFGVETGGGSG